MNTLEWQWTSSDGLNMFAKAWLPDVPPKAAIGLIHGLGEHIGRYEHVGATLTEAGYALLGFDHRGHGRSGGPRGHTPSYEALLDDISSFLKQIEERYPDRPCFLYGHSMGGNLVINYPLRRPSNLNGAVATAPFLELAFQPPAIKVKLGRLMNNLIPSFTQASGLETAALSRDPQVVQAYEQDPLVHDKISARLFVSLFDAGLYALDHAADFPLPMLLVHGTADRLTSAEASRRFGAAAPFYVTTELWDGWYHELHNELEKERFFRRLIAWLDEYSTARG